MEKLTKSDLEIILESLEYSKMKFEEYQKYPSPEFKQKRIDDVVAVIDKIRQLKKNS